MTVAEHYFALQDWLPIAAAHRSHGEISSCVSDAEAMKIAEAMRDSDEGTDKVSGAWDYVGGRIAGMVKQAYGLA